MSLIHTPCNSTVISQLLGIQKEKAKNFSGSRRIADLSVTYDKKGLAVYLYKEQVGFY